MRSILVLIFFIVVPHAHAQTWHFFGSVDAARSTIDRGQTYQNIKKTWTSADLMTAGLNVSGHIDEKTQGLIQVIHNPESDKLSVDLVQVQSNLPWNMRGRFGKQRAPIFLMSEHIQVNALIPWTMVPSQVYQRNPINSINGVSLEKDVQDFTFHIYGGDVHQKLEDATTEYTVESSVIYGGRINWRRGQQQAYVHYSATDATLDVRTPTEISTNVFADASVLLPIKRFESLTGGTDLHFGSWWVMGEYLRTQSRSNALSYNEGFYSSLGYVFTEQFSLLGTYADDITSHSTLFPSTSTTYNLTGIYRVNANTVFKASLSHIDFQERTRPSPFGVDSSRGLGFSGVPSSDFDVAHFQLAFIL
jgi:hypothetical protein